MTDHTDPCPQPQARYILPSFIDSSFGVKESNPYNKLFEERIIFLGVQVDDASANDIMAQLLVLESLDPDRDITMYINSPGGSFTSLMAIYDTMQYVRADIQTVCLSQAASAAAVLLAAGTPGKRLALPNARILIHQALSGVIQGQFSDLEIQAKEIERMRTLMETTLAHHTGKDAEQIRKDTDRDKILTAEEAKEYGAGRHRPRVPQAVSSERLALLRGDLRRDVVDDESVFRLRAEHSFSVLDDAHYVSGWLWLRLRAKSSARSRETAERPRYRRYSRSSRRFAPMEK